MTFTPYITIYPEGNFDHNWFGDSLIRATLIFSKNLDYNKSLSRKRINIHLGNEERAHINGNIKSIWIKNKVDTTKDLSIIDKIQIVLKIIYDSVLNIAEIEEWDTIAFEKAFRNSIADNGNFIWHSPIKKNKNRSLNARIKITLENDGKVHITAEFLNSKSMFQFEVPIIDTFLHFVNWEKRFMKPIWIDNQKFGFNFLNSQLQIFANSDSKQSETIVSEKSLTRKEIEGELRRITYKQFSNNKEYVEWANK